MIDPHIASAFDRDLEAIQAMLMKMGGLVEASILNGAEALERRDLEMAEAVRAGDKAIDRLEEQVNEEATRVIALRAPTASDLRTVMTVIKISANLERCGDYAKNIAKRTLAIESEFNNKQLAVGVEHMSDLALEQLKAVLDAYTSGDLEVVQRVHLRDDEVDALYTSLFRQLLTYMMEDPRSITMCAHLLFCAKNIERIGDHATNIAENIYYMISGNQLPADRPKTDELADSSPV